MAHNTGSTRGDREQYLLLPLADVTRVMCRIVPHARISDDAKEAVQCASEFIGIVTSEAVMRCQDEKCRTITAEDLLWAMDSLGFEDYIAPLTLYLNRYRESEGGAESGLLRGEPFARRPC